MSKILQHYSISVDLNPKTEDIEVISRNLSADAVSQSGYPKNHCPIALFVRNSEDSVAGGLIADISWGWLYILKIWVQESLRGKGIGTLLLETAETEAKKRGCSYAYLDTFSFQARPLYEKLGYEVIITLDDFPPGHKKYFMKKCLT